MLAKAKSLILTSDKLFVLLTEAMEKIFPVKRVTWKVLSRAIAEAERSNGAATSLVLVSPATRVTGRKGQQKQSLPSLSLFIEAIEGNKVRARILFPLYGEVRQQNKILQILLAGLRHNGFLVQSGGIAMEIDLPFVPVEVKYGETNGNNGYQQRAFICPEEIISVT